MDKKNWFYVVLISTLLFSPVNSIAQCLFDELAHLFTPARNYVIYQTNDKITIDGRADEKSWINATWSEKFDDIEGDLKPKPLHNTRFKMLWDNENLYIFAELIEPHIWAYYDKNDMIVYHENDFEVFIDPDRDTHSYYEFEVNARNTLFDLYLDKPYRNGGKPDIKWNAEGFRSAVQVYGSLNDHTDSDKKWTVEMVIPFSSLSTSGNYLHPENGSTWKINFSRVNWQTDITDGKYIRKINPETKKRIPEYNWVWSPQGVINMHYPERWGLAQFSSMKVGTKNIDFALPLDEELAKYLWLVYYKQQKYVNAKGKYAVDLDQLGIPGSGKVGNIKFSLQIKSSGKDYKAVVESSTGVKLKIDREGHVVKM